MTDTLAPPAPAAHPRGQDRPASPPTGQFARLAALGARRCAAPTAFLLLWELAPRLGLVDRVFLPPLSEVLGTLLVLVRNGQMGEHVAASLGRGLTGFLIAVATAIPLGILVAWYRPVCDLLAPLLEVFRNTAALALLPVFVLLFGIGETSKIALVVYACTFPILLNTITGVRTVDPLLVKAAVSLGFSPVSVFTKVVLPAAVPSVFTGIRMAGTSSILVLVAAEMVGARSGLGYLVQASQLNFQITHMYAGIIAIAAVGLLLNQLLVSLERRFSRWRLDHV
ncbi:putative ABC transporter membrane protein [Thermobifida fusca YX]|uniref:Putative ABC transporter membrane protein n=1 Tax=Thermobifida fusca (strain YX) TaxID=269800 RepID=Q47P92_THEFY|nr:putative ABC transporter membrane protein [Thermobifida fusca YX]